MKYDFNVNQIVFACRVLASYEKAIYNNRACHCLALHLAGDKDYHFSDGTVLNVQENSIIFLPKFSSYETQIRESGDCLAINFDLDEDVHFSPFVMHLKNAKEVENAFQRTIKAFYAKSEGYVLKCKCELYNILHLLVKEYFTGYQPSQKHEMILPAVEMIHSRFLSDAPSVAELALKCGITPEYFRKLFKSFYGVSPLKYINDLKISHAKALLESKMYSVAEVALQSGFSDATHFSREFKKATGLSPSKYTTKPPN